MSLILHIVDCLLRVVALEDGVAGHKDVGTGLEEFGGILQVDAAVNLDEALRVLAIAEGTQLTHLAIGILDELLTAEAGVDAHEKHQVALLDDVLEFYFIFLNFT